MKNLIAKIKAAVKPMENEKGMELIQTLGLAAIAIVLISLMYTTLNTNFGTWMNSVSTHMTTLLGKFSVS